MFLNWISYALRLRGISKRIYSLDKAVISRKNAKGIQISQLRRYLLYILIMGEGFVAYRGCRCFPSNRSQRLSKNLSTYNGIKRSAKASLSSVRWAEQPPIGDSFRNMTDRAGFNPPLYLESRNFIFPNRHLLN